MTYDSNYNVNVYVNGVFKGGGTSANPIEFRNNFTFGNWDTGESFDVGFGGLMDEVQVYNRPLSDCEIRNLYDAASGSPQESCVGPTPTPTATPTPSPTATPTPRPLSDFGSLPQRQPADPFAWNPDRNVFVIGYGSSPGTPGALLATDTPGFLPDRAQYSRRLPCFGNRRHNRPPRGKQR